MMRKGRRVHLVGHAMPGGDLAVRIRQDPQRQRAAASIQGSPGAAGGAGPARRIGLSSRRPRRLPAALRRPRARRLRRSPWTSIKVNNSGSGQIEPGTRYLGGRLSAERPNVTLLQLIVSGGLPTTCRTLKSFGVPAWLARTTLPTWRPKAAHGVPRTSSSQPGRRGAVPSRRGVDCFGRCSRMASTSKTRRAETGELPRCTLSSPRPPRTAPCGRPQLKPSTRDCKPAAGEAKPAAGEEDGRRYRRALREVTEQCPERWPGPGGPDAWPEAVVGEFPAIAIDSDRRRRSEPASAATSS